MTSTLNPMQRVLILGSKPDAIIPSFDHAYCANAAASYYQGELSHRGGKTYSVVASGQITKRERRPNNKKLQHYDEKTTRILESRNDGVILILPPDKSSAKRKIKEGISVVEVTERERERILRNISGLDEPVGPCRLTEAPITVSTLYIYTKLLQNAFQAIGKERRPPAAFRASTGIFSLAYAILQHGTQSEYIISGIGLSDRENYKDKSFKQKRKIPRHSHADTHYLSALSARFNIRTTEEEIYQRTGIPLF